MKILHALYDDLKNPWLGGGGAVRAFEINRRLAQKHEIIVVTGNYPNARDEEREGILYKRVGSSRSYFLSRLSYPLASLKFIRKSDYDILIDDFSAFSPCFSPLHTGKTVVTIIHHLISTHAIRKYRFGVMPLLIEKFALKLYKNFIFMSPSVKEQIVGKIVKKYRAKVIPNGVNNALFSLKASEKNYMLFLGRIDVYQKGLDILLKAFKNITKREMEIGLIIAGGGKDSYKLKELISKLDSFNVKFIGRISDHKKKKLLSNCLFVCMPSRFEGYGIVAIEAAACGKPVVGTRIPGLCDTVIDGETGILVGSNNSEELSKAMLKLIEDRNLRKKLGRNGRRWAKKFGWDMIAKMQEEFYFECLE